MKKYGFMEISYEDGAIVPTIKMGGGNIKVTSYLKRPDSGEVGIGFCEVESKKEIGTRDDSNYGKKTDQKKVNFQLMFDNEKSIDVVIDSLVRAKNYLKGEN